jgi:hypothetical protein
MGRIDRESKNKIRTEKNAKEKTENQMKTNRAIYKKKKKNLNSPWG